MPQVPEVITLTLIREAQQGRSESIARLSEEVREIVTVYLYRITLDYHLAQDLCQETLIQMIRYLPKLKIEHPRFLRSWLFKTATSKVHKHLRKRRPVNLEGHIHPDTLFSAAAESGSHRAEQKELAQTVTRAMNGLKSHHRNILVLRCYENLSYREIVTIMGGTEIQAKLLFFRAKGYLKRQLQRNGYDAAYLLPALGAYAALTAGSGPKATAAVLPTTLKVGASATVVGNLLTPVGIGLVSLLTAGSLMLGLRPHSLPSEPLYSGPIRTAAFSQSDLTPQVEALLEPLAAHYVTLNIGLIQDANLIYTQSYGKQGHIHRRGDLISVSKPITAMICLRLLEQGRFDSLDVNIWDMHPQYRGCLPPDYQDHSLTLRHLLTHTSGLPGYRDSMWQGKYLDLRFRPGTDESYSSHGYTILGHILEHVTQESFAQLVRRHIYEPLQLSSLNVRPIFEAPAYGCSCNINDLGRFVIGVMQGTLVSRAYLLEHAFAPLRANRGLGWQVENPESPDLTVSHGGGSQNHGAYVIFKPHQHCGVVLMGEKRQGVSLPDLKKLGAALLDLLTSAPADTPFS